MEKLDLNGVRIYSNTKDDAKDAMDLIGQDVYNPNKTLHLYGVYQSNKMCYNK